MKKTNVGEAYSPRGRAEKQQGNCCYHACESEKNGLGGAHVHEGAVTRVLPRHPDHPGTFGFIAPYSNKFCGDCNRLRVSSTGGLKLPGVYSDLVRVMGMEPVLHMRVTLSELVMSALVMVGVALLAAWVPARRAAALEPVEAMRHVD